MDNQSAKMRRPAGDKMRRPPNNKKSQIDEKSQARMDELAQEVQAAVLKLAEFAYMLGQMHARKEDNDG